MKIAMIGHKRIPSREGGIEIVVEELGKRMVLQGNDVTIYNRSGKHVSGAEYSHTNEQKQYLGMRIITVPTPKSRSLNAIVYSFFATVHAMFSGYDVIHYHAEGPSVMINFAKLCSAKIVATIHGLDWQRDKWGGFATKFLLFGERTVAKKAKKIIVLSANVQQYFKDTYNRETVFIPNAVNTPRTLAPNIIKQKYDLDKNKYILFLARLVPEKGLHFLLEAFANLPTDIKLVIAGGSSHSNDYVQQMQQEAAKDLRVIMTGFVQGEELDELFSNCFLYVLPSTIEGMPLSLLEAISFGRPCLVSNIQENTAVIGKYGAVFESGNVNNLREVLGEIIAGRKTFVESAVISKDCFDRFSWDDITSRHLELYASSGKT